MNKHLIKPELFKQMQRIAVNELGVRSVKMGDVTLIHSNYMGETYTVGFFERCSYFPKGIYFMVNERKFVRYDKKEWNKLRFSNEDVIRGLEWSQRNDAEIYNASVLKKLNESKENNGSKIN